MPQKRKDLTQAEIWDDSALVDSWNEAYEEYKFYHSIHARGEKVKDVLDAYSRGEDEANMIDQSSHSAQIVQAAAGEAVAGSEDGEIEDGEVGSEQQPAETASSEQQRRQQSTSMKVAHESIHQPQQPAVPATQAVPEQLLANGPQGSALKNLMMSWYWAGYYSGFYEGQQQATTKHE